MRRLIILLLILPFITVGQKYVVSNGKYVKINGKYVRDAESTTPSYQFQPETEAFWTRLTGTPDISWKYDFDSLVVYLKDTNIWQSADAMYLFAFQNASDALLNLVGDTNNSVAVNTVVFTAGEGYNSNGTTGYINSHYNPDADNVHWQLDDACMYGYVSAYTSGTFTPFGVSSPWYAGYFNVSSQIAINSNINVTSITKSTGGFGLSRVNSTGFMNYYAGSANTVSQSSVTIPSKNTYILAFNNSDNYAANISNSSMIMSFVYFGGSLSEAQMQRLDDIIAWWLVKVSDNP